MTTSNDKKPRSRIGKDPDVPLAEALSILGCSEDDLFYAAKEGRIAIYVMAGNSTVQAIKGTDYREAAAIPLAAQSRFSGNPDGDIHLGQTALFRRQGELASVYGCLIAGLQKIQADTFRLYKESPETTEVAIDGNHCTPIPKEMIELKIYPDPALLLCDALRTKRLFVKRADIDSFNAEIPNIDLMEAYGKDDWSEELGLAISGWVYQHENYDEKSGGSRKAMVETWLKGRLVNGKPLSKEQIDRIATIANQDKKPGRRKKGSGN